MGSNPWIGAPSIQVWGFSSNTGANQNSFRSGSARGDKMGENTRVWTGFQNGAWGWRSECDREPDDSYQKVFNLFIYNPPAACVDGPKGYTCPDNMDSTLTDICNFDAPVY